MGISSIQKRRIFEEINRVLYASGDRPTLNTVLREMSRYFARHPVGIPLSSSVNYASDGLVSDVDKFNQLLAFLSMNLDVGYESVNEQVNDIMMLTTLLQSHLTKLQGRRKILTSKIDDYLFSTYNTDGYYFSSSDSFNDLGLSDLTLSTAFVDTTMGNVTIPSLSDQVNKIPPGRISNAAIMAVVGGVKTPTISVSPFQGCVDGLSNTIWSSEVETSAPSEVILVVKITVGNQREPAVISRIELDPYGIEDVQMMVATEDSSSVVDEETEEATVPDATLALLNYTGLRFGDSIQTSGQRMVFTDISREVSSVNILLRKTVPDYTITTSGVVKYRYIFAAKEIAFSEQIYDNSATFVSGPLSIPSELQGDNVIDAVSLVVSNSVPNDTSISYFVAADIPEATSIETFSWKPIDPIDTINPKTDSIVHFDGASTIANYLRVGAVEPEIPMIPLKAAIGTPPSELNPSPDIIPATDVYRLASFKDDALAQSLVLEEGVNSTKIMYVNATTAASTTLAFWTDYVNGTKKASVRYGRIDNGFEFFDGGDIGEANKSVYLETYLDSATEQTSMLKTFKKTNENSLFWDVQLYLNGRQIGSIPAGTKEAIIPWKFVQGLNQILMLINIPASTTAFPHIYEGNLDLMSTESLYNFGTVKLATWNYVDIFKMKYNEVGEPFTFTIYNDEIISRRKPTDNFRIKYSKATDSAPAAVRLRADLSRSVSNPSVTPVLDLYRLRFLYQ